MTNKTKINSNVMMINFSSKTNIIISISVQLFCDNLINVCSYKTNFMQMTLSLDKQQFNVVCVINVFVTKLCFVYFSYISAMCVYVYLHNKIMQLYSSNVSLLSFSIFWILNLNFLPPTPRLFFFCLYRNVCFVHVKIFNDVIFICCEWTWKKINH